MGGQAKQADGQRMQDQGQIDQEAAMAAQPLMPEDRLQEISRNLNQHVEYFLGTI